jgi:glycopeptide antibiotics resistance protein
MPRSKPVAFLLGLYIPVLFVGLLLPRRASVETAPVGFLKRLLHDILFLSGPPEIFLNFLLFIPFFFALLYLAPALDRRLAALIACLTSAAAELAQSQIPGRVSSIRDFASNCLGVVMVLILATVFSKRKAHQAN